MEEVTLKDGSGVRIFSVVPSIDTGCVQPRLEFNEEAAKLRVEIWTFSVDLPFAQGDIVTRKVLIR